MQLGFLGEQTGFTCSRNRSVRQRRGIAFLRRLPGITLLLSAFGAVLPTAAHADRLTVYAIAAPQPTRWESPRALLSSTVVNSVSSGYAPNGHVMIRLEQGSRAWLTSMATAKKGQAFSVTVRRGLGLSSLYHDFDGKLDSAEDSRELMNRAARDGRLASLQVEVDPAVMKEMVSFLDQWIRRGSFRHYRGGQIASAGVGAGCADFVMWFMNRAFHHRAPLTIWMRDLFLPKDLLEHTSPVEIFRRTEWAKGMEDGRPFMIPDPELLFNWIVERSPAAREIRLERDALDREPKHALADLLRFTNFEPSFEPESDESVAAVWKSITLR